ncbi:hypothetical protein AB4238_02825 [Shewanella sp. 10N.286.45.A1]|uniref:hypothetical protein n=1 Tax=Shewanella sp. 10N.286.45.A1 TaxID=3229694 RepID=UPI00354E4ED6
MVGDDIINSDTVFKFVEKSDCNSFVFSGGGIIKSRLLSIPGKKFIHTLPGLVPEIRRADCLFWSLLIKGKPGYSCFYMSPEIDEGDIFYTEEFPFSLCKIEGISCSYSDIYNGLLQSLDLHLRSACLINSLSYIMDDNFNVIESPTKKQKSSEGRMFFYMHEELKEHILAKLQ